ncbi:hypothetical protein RMSM_07810 [Rhodopirellula maiorica SM1]|uniref:Uncharacterized protein n=2 Tax=Novipirellula TaxID=2795426 RepID=M5RIS3_9BACT|nr:hypothetical protein RMSM_07810 [Rhodopirellula maiorica SM1]
MSKSSPSLCLRKLATLWMRCHHKPRENRLLEDEATVVVGRENLFERLDQPFVSTQRHFGAFRV